MTPGAPEESCPLPRSIPLILLGLLLGLWLAFGIWAALKAPFASGTDESISYVALAAAKNRWATEEDFHRFGIDHFYYPPLYFLAFAPFWGDDPAFVENYPKGETQDPNYMNKAGRRLVNTDFAARVPPSLERLYRAAKLFSVGLGLTVLLALAATLWLLFPGPARWWIVLLGTAPLVLLPQFLYYHSLVNNDTLLNALGALACLAFAAAILALERRDDRRFLRLSLAAAACIGLAFLTKMSAPVLLPLLPGLAWARFRAERSSPLRQRLRRSLALLIGLTAVIFVCGGWWIAYKAGQGDWNSFKAHRLAHPWAVADRENLAIPAYWLEQLLLIGRSYFGLFTGALVVNVPDTIILAWLAAPAAVFACAVAIAVGAIRGRTAGWPPWTGHDLRPVVWLTFAAVLALNVASILVNLLVTIAPYGRLLFPSLVASHALAAAIIAAALRSHPRALAAVTLLFVAHGAILFGLTFADPMAAAITQPPEDVRILTGTEASLSAGPIWAGPTEQPLMLPPGELKALRVKVDRWSVIPQVGAALEGTLTVWPAAAPPQRLRVLRLALGDNDTNNRWAELELERSIRLEKRTPALLTLNGAPPKWLPGYINFSFACGGGGESAHFNGQDFDCALLLAGVYRPGADPAPRPPGK